VPSTAGPRLSPQSPPARMVNPDSLAPGASFAALARRAPRECGVIRARSAHQYAAATDLGPYPTLNALGHMRCSAQSAHAGRRA
jgi:hypothetical protein